MKQIWREMKKQGLISQLPRTLIVGGIAVCGFLLTREDVQQFLGLTENVTDAKTDNIMKIIMIGLLAFILFLDFLILIGRPLKDAKAFVRNLSQQEQEQMLLDFQNAWRGSRTHRIGREYTYICDEGPDIYRNRDIIWIYPWTETGARGAKRYYFNLYLINQEAAKIIGTTEKTQAAIMAYYEKYFPHIVVGRSDEADYLFRKDRERFLQLKYYVANGKEEERKS